MPNRGLGVAPSVTVLAAVVLLSTAAQDEKEPANSIGMKLLRIAPGKFTRGGSSSPLPGGLGPTDGPNEYPSRGDFDEHPPHRVRITRAFLMGATEVTNAQYERFDPDHRALRGKMGFSKEDDEAVVYVSWHDAVRFCRWLSEKEGKPYRLPTEAEWEYACRAGTTGAFHTGDSLPESHQKRNRIPKWKGPAWYPAKAKAEECVVPLTVGKTPANPWGLHDLHGNVEEWCLDAYGPYEAGDAADPVGRATGEFRVTRGGSHSTPTYYLRSANRSGTLPEDRHWLIGFRVVQAPLPATSPLPAPPPPRSQRDVRKEPPPDLARGPDPERPFFKGPRTYVRVPPGSLGPMFSRHNHVPGLVACPNGDLLAAWFSCIDEPGREVALLASRLRHGREEWDEASPFWDAPDRTEEATALWFDGKETIYHFICLGAAGTWGNSALALRTSTDSGATWSAARLVSPEHGPGPHGKSWHMPVESVFRARDGAIVLPCDANPATVLHASRDEGRTWSELEGRIAGIHAGVAELQDGRWLAFGRGQNLEGRSPMSVSADGGKTWTVSASPFPALSNGQRLVLRRLREGPLFFASFAGTTPVRYGTKALPKNNGEDLVLKDAAGRERRVRGLFAALSFDEGRTWPVRKLITGEGPARELDLTYGGKFTMDADSGEPQGYLALCQTPDGVLHLITSQRHYAFNLAWLKAPLAPRPE